MRIICIVLAVMLDIIPSGEAFLRQLQQRDSILIADQLEYGVEIAGVGRGTLLGFPDFASVSNDTLTVVSDWQVDTVYDRKSKSSALRAYVVIAPFEAAEYALPDIYVQRTVDGKTDTLLFSAQKMMVKTMPLDTATFVVNDLKGQIKYPVTFAETLPWIGIAFAVAALAFIAVRLVRKYRRKAVEEAHRDPAHIVALRELDKYRSDKYWAPERQKAFYSGITDALKVYMEDRFGVDAPEMTTAELFAALKSDKDITPELYSEMKALFERADFVKFAKFVVSDEDNARALPSAVMFVTSTYQAELEDEGGEEAVDGK